MKSRVLSLLPIEATHVTLGIKAPLPHEALDPFIRAKNGAVLSEADPAFVEQVVNMRREEQPMAS
jgi:hypothetical protein